MDAQLRAGIAIYNAGGYHAAHDAWEDRWLSLETGTADERLLHGLIQFTAAIYHARRRNWTGATGLAESGGEYLAELPPKARGVNVDEVRAYLAVLGSDPEVIERTPPPLLTHNGASVTFADLDFEATAVVARVLASELAYDEPTVEHAIEYARADLESETTGSPFVTFLFDFVRNPADRDIVFQRLSEHVRRRKSRDSDVENLFE